MIFIQVILKNWLPKWGKSQVWVVCTAVYLFSSLKNVESIFFSPTLVQMFSWTHKSELIRMVYLLPLSFDLFICIKTKTATGGWGEGLWQHSKFGREPTPNLGWLRPVLTEASQSFEFGTSLPQNQHLLLWSATCGSCGLPALCFTITSSSLSELEGGHLTRAWQHLPIWIGFSRISVKVTVKRDKTSSFPFTPTA